MQPPEPNPNDPFNSPQGAPPNIPRETPATPPSTSPPVESGQFQTPAPRPNTVSIDVIGQSWELLKPHLGMWIVALLICGAISGVLNGASSLLSLAGGDEPSGVTLALTSIISIASVLLGLLVNAGLMKMAIHHVRSGQADIGKLFDITDVIAPILIAGVLMYIAIGLGLVLLIVPGIIAALGLSMAIPLVVDQKIDGIEALKRSWAVCKPHLGALFLLFLVIGLVNIAGFCACFVGLLITSPMTQLAIALTYRNLFGIERTEANIAPSPFPPPPIANP